MADCLITPADAQTVFRFIRCRRTKRYFKDGEWKEDPCQASMFSSQIEAVEACAEHDLKDVELVLRAPGANTDLFCTLIR